MSTLKADTIQAATTNGNLAISNQGTGGIAIDGMPHRNLIINGDMAIDQRGSSGTIANGSFMTDRWKWNQVGAGAVTATQDTDVPTAAEAGTCFKFSLKLDVTTADGSIAATDEYVFTQSIEGFNTAHLGLGTSGAATVMLSFWVKAPKTGTWSGAISNSAINRAYAFEYTISVADTWERKTVKIVLDTGGTWIGATNGIGLRLWFALALGSNFTGTAGSWEAANDQGSTNQVNGLDSTSNNFFLTGVQLEVGAAATDFEHRDYASELARCQRYFIEQDIQNNGGYWTGNTTGSTSVRFVNHLPVAMRSTPTLTTNTVGNLQVHGETSSKTPSAAGMLVSSGLSGGLISMSVTISGGSSDNMDTIQGVGDCGFQFDAEL